MERGFAQVLIDLRMLHGKNRIAPRRGILTPRLIYNPKRLLQKELLMATPFEFPVLLRVRSSPRLSAVIIFLHAGAAVAPFWAQVPAWALAALLGVIAASLIHVFYFYILQYHPHAPVQLVLTTREEWWLTCTGRQSFRVRLLPAALVHPLLTVLVFRDGRRRYPVILTPDVVDADQFRRLRVRLRLSRDSLDSI